MAALTNDRRTNQMEGNGPKGFASGPPANFNVFYGQLLVEGTDGLLRQAQHSATMSGSVCVGVSQHTNFNITPTTPLPEGNLVYRTGVFAYNNDVSNPVLTTTLPGALLFATDDQTVGLSQAGGLNALAGRLAVQLSSATGAQVWVVIGPTTSISGSSF